ncbi:hypothetical protein SELR_19470 [Selenomonas ruminantium subsp. lactilytica TAM6421]|uniref:Uncharacterized protein n=1 Tax=Selenomonas ruminantium subsp. lactilytica (strain NBRC 103574 / TAM6421) TaxID=927704 RepID=I0GSB8_SELRL|nr:DUF6033 family protein [Selenomonas ruminantium]BAL83655.1 hypothetical protein SELR_19470 [Selenomonas ruminantium subsp. lactilytica TAM6421]
MPVKVGGSYVSEAAYSFAKARATDKKEDSDVMKSLAEKFPNLKFSVGTAPFAGTGTNNVSISSKILKQIEQDPEKRMEYEALIYDIAHTDVTGGNMSGRKVKSHGFIIEDDGGLRSWGISEYDDGNRRQQSHLKRSDKKNWWQDMLGKPREKKKKFANTNELTKYLQENFSMVKAGMAKISGKYLQKCLTDEESRLKLFDNLRVAEDVYNNRKDEVGFQGMQVTIDEDGEMSMTSSKTTVSLNENKRRRQIAAAATQGDMQSVVALLEQDLQQLEDGLRLNQCDAAEVEKAKKLLEQAKERMGRLPDRAATPAEQNAMTVNMLI